VVRDAVDPLNGDHITVDSRTESRSGQLAPGGIGLCRIPGARSCRASYVGVNGLLISGCEVFAQVSGWRAWQFVLGCRAAGVPR
jgi:hypothetical protein